MVLHFDTELNSDCAPAMLGRFLSIIGRDPWVKRYRSLHNQLQANPLLKPYLADAHGLTLRLGQLLADNRSPTFSDQGDYALFSFIAPVVLIYEQLTDFGKKRVAGTLQDGLNTDVGLRPFKSEIETVTYLARRGFEVTPNDIERGSGFDFLAVRGGVELEVECKAASGDLGRQVHRRRMMELSWLVWPVIQRALSSVRGGRLGKVLLPGSLVGRREVLSEIAAAIEQTVDQATSLSTERCDIEWRPFGLAETPFALGDPAAVTNDTVEAFLDRELGHANRHAFVGYRPGRSAIVLVVESRKADALLQGLIRDLKTSSKTQFTKRRPGVLVVQFLELRAADILEMKARESDDPKQAPAIQIATSQFFRNPDRAHIHTLVYRAQGTLHVTVAEGDGRRETSYQEQGPTYSFKNHQHPLADDPGCSVFGL